MDVLGPLSFIAATTNRSAGCQSYPDDFIVSGTGAEMMMGACESFWRPNFEPDELVEVISQCLLAGLDRDALSGWGAVVHLMSALRLFKTHYYAHRTPSMTRTVYLKSRQD